MRFYYDCEFMEDPLAMRQLELISIGIVAEDGSEFYAENRYADLSRANDWVKMNVVPHLDMVKAGDKQKGGGITPTEIREGIIEFVGASPEHRPEFWAYYGAYDWVILCQLFGRMIDLPLHWPMHHMDLQQEVVRLGYPQKPKQEGTEHQALDDARWNRDLHAYLRGVERARS